MSDRKLSEVLTDYQEPEHFKAPAYAERQVRDEELTNEDRFTGLAILVVCLLVILGVGWASCGVRDAMTRAEMAREGR
jgi:hypothetical protein